jgi:hypothetical protein
VTIRDPEILEALRENPELLALADAVHETQLPPPRRRAAGLGPRVGAVAIAVAAIVLVALFVPDRAARHGVIGRALAAIGHGRVLHLRTEVPSGLVYIDLKSGRRTPLMVQDEVWYDRETKRFHYLVEAHGKVADFVWPDDAQPGTTVQPGVIDPAFAALLTGYREALANGDAKLERTGTFEGRPVYWIRFPSGTEVAIDRRSYKPVLFRERAPNGGRIDERVLVAETLDYHATDFKRRGAGLFEAGTEVHGGYSLDIPPKAPVVKAPWLTAGSTVIGLPLKAVSQTTQSTKTRSSRGVVLIYGHVRGNPDLTIEEFRRPADPNTWSGIPRGAVAVQGGGKGSEWSGSLVKDGVYITIETTRGEKALLQVARALRRA